MPARWMVCTAFMAAGCAQAEAPAQNEFDGEAALASVRTQVGFGPRIPGAAGHDRMRAWLDSLLPLRADSVVIQAWEHRTADGRTLALTNFIARFNPAARDRLLFLAHWDTRPVADAVGSSDSTLPVPGANDGASGVAVLLGMADALQTEPPRKIGVDLLFVDGEDFGSWSDPDLRDVLLGSRYYAEHPLPGPKPLYAVVFDMVGDQDLQIFQEGYSLTAAPDVVERVWKTAAELGYGSVFVARPDYTLTDDHVPLQRAGFRAIDVIDFYYPPWHTPDDTVDKVSARSLGIVGHVALTLIRRHG